PRSSTLRAFPTWARTVSRIGGCSGGLHSPSERREGPNHDRGWGPFVVRSCLQGGGPVPPGSRRRLGRLGGADDRAVHAGDGLVGELDLSVDEPGGREAVEVLAARERARDAADV